MKKALSLPFSLITIFIPRERRKIKNDNAVFSAAEKDPDRYGTGTQNRRC